MFDRYLLIGSKYSNSILAFEFRANNPTIFVVVFDIPNKNKWICKFDNFIGEVTCLQRLDWSYNCFLIKSDLRLIVMEFLLWEKGKLLLIWEMNKKNDSIFDSVDNIGIKNE